MSLWGRSASLNISRSEVGVNSFVAHRDLKAVVNHSGGEALRRRVFDFLTS